MLVLRCSHAPEYVVTSRSLQPHTKTESQSDSEIRLARRSSQTQSHVPAFTGVRVVDRLSSMAMPARPPSPMPIAKTAVCTPTLLYPNDHATLAHIAASTAARLQCAEVRLDETIRLPYGAGGRTRSFAAKHA